MGKGDLKRAGRGVRWKGRESEVERVGGFDRRVDDDEEATGF